MTVLGREEILNILPHGEAFLYVDSVESLDHSEQAVKGIKYLPTAHASFNGHFEEEKVFPAVLQIEAMAQLSGIGTYLLNKNNLPNGDDIFEKAFLSESNVIFKGVIKPEDQMEIHSKFRRRFGPTVEYNVSITVADKCMSRGRLKLTFISSELEKEMSNANSH